MVARKFQTPEISDDRWWALISDSFPSTGQLTCALRALSHDELLDLAGFVAECRSAVREPWEGPYIDEGIGHLSEDSTEDLTDWIVSQGKSYWSDAVEATDEHLRRCFELYYAARKPGHPRAWQPTPVPHLMGTLHTVWCERFEADELLDFLSGEG